MTVLDPAPPVAVPLSGTELDLLTKLLRLPTAGPLEVGPGVPVELWAAQRAYAAAAAELGFTVLRHAAPRPEELPAFTRSGWKCRNSWMRVHGTSLSP